MGGASPAPGGWAVKKNNGRHKASGRRKKGRQKAGPAPLKATRAPAIAPSKPAHRPAPSVNLAVPRLGRVDWPALAILAAPLALMALLHSHRVAPFSQLAGAPAHVELPREAERLRPEPAPQAALVPPTVFEQEPAPIEVQPQQASPAEAAPLIPTESEPVAPPIQEHAAMPEPAVEGAPAAEPVPPAYLASLEPELVPSMEPWHSDLANEAAPPITEPENAHDALPPPSLPVLASLSPAPQVPAMCVPDEPALSATPMPRPTNFGAAIAAAARAQTEDFVIYNPRYMRIAYPGGDTHPLYGVCTDVLIRAYRALGIDLQALIHTSRLGRGDPSIDHRRVEIVRRFLERHGTSLPISDFAEDFRPGDIVTYHRPGGRTSQYHIAVVSDRMAPSGRPLVVHNRGWGPQLEDALFVDRITGHYRLSPEQVEAFERTRTPHLADNRRRRTADAAGLTRR